MVSMKTGGNEVQAVGSNPYGYGLTICLNDEQVEALGLDKTTPAVNTEVGIRAVARVVMVNKRSDPAEEVAEGEDAADIDTRIELQITDMEVNQAAQPGAHAAALYGGEDG